MPLGVGGLPVTVFGIPLLVGGAALASVRDGVEPVGARPAGRPETGDAD